MQNVQNAAEIQQRVINLVELYRTKVGKESQVAKDAKEEYEFWVKENENMAKEAFDAGETFLGWMHGEGSHTEMWIKHLQVNEQLLGHFYSVVAGSDAEKEVLDQLLADVYDKSIFTEEEEDFLTSHFREMVNYIILTPCDDELKWVNRHDGKDAYTIPSEVLELIKARVEIPAGSRIYYRYTLFAQLANLFDGCTYYCDTMFYAWTRVALYANNIDVETIDVNTIPSSYDAALSYLPKDFEGHEARLVEVYNNLPIGGKFIMLCSPTILKDENYKSFRNTLIEDKAIKEIIQLPQVMSDNASFDTYCLLIAEKGCMDSEVTLIDARISSSHSESKHFRYTLDLDKFNALLQNDGKDPNTGLRKAVKMSADNLSQGVLMPQVYTIERPSETESPIPMSNLCTLESTLVRDIQYNLPEDTPWITMSDLTPLYTGDLDMSGIRKADCPNNPPFVEGSKDFGFDKDGKFVDTIWAQMNKKKGHHVLDYRQCTFLDGNCDTVLYEYSAEHGVRVAVVRATGRPYAVSSGILVFCPKGDFDAESLAVLLRLPIVYRQLLAYQEYGLHHRLKDILVPTDKRIISDELYRMKREESVTNELGDKAQAMKTEYINEVRMRKHDMGQYIFELMNIEDLMRYYFDNKETEKDFCQQIGSLLDNFRTSIGELSNMLDNLSKEDKFGEPESLNLNDYLSQLECRHKADGYKIVYEFDQSSVKKYYQKFSRDLIDAISANMPLLEDKGTVSNGLHSNNDVNFANTDSLFNADKVPSLFVARNDIQRAVNNILDNAKKHGFTDPNRHDYEVKIRLSINNEKEMFQIDFCNNGKPLPEGMNKMRYGIKGEKAGKTAGTGIGGNYVKSFVEHYGGDYDVFMEDGWIVVRILLPFSPLI